MAYPTFVPNPRPDHDMNVKVEQEILEANFGEYSQRAEDGINSQKLNLSPQWKNLYYGEAIVLIAFFKERGRTKPFWWKPPEEPKAYLFYCDSFDYNWKIGRRCDISCKFTQTNVP